MQIVSDKLNCYIEGIRIPISGINLSFNRNYVSTATIKIALGESIIPHCWANALIQISYINNFKEHLLYQGLITDIEIIESDSYITIETVSGWSSANFNTTMDYVAPKKYGIQNIEEELTFYLGNEEIITTDNGDIGDNYHLSNRYFFLKEGLDVSDRKVISQDDPESYKLQYIGDRTPFAELFGFTILEQMAYNNFILTRAHVERLNLLSKVGVESIRGKNFKTLLTEVIEDTILSLELDAERTGIAYVKAKIQTVGTAENAIVSLGLGDVGGNLPYKAIAQGARLALEKHSSKGNFTDMHGIVTVDQILNAYNIYCQSANIDPNLMIAQANHESTFNPRALSPTGYKGWAQFGQAAWSESSSKPYSEVFSILESISAQIRYMHKMFTYANGDFKRALSNYVDGPNAKNRPQTPAYISSIVGIYNSYFK